MSSLCQKLILHAIMRFLIKLRTRTNIFFIGDTCNELERCITIFVNDDKNQAVTDVLPLCRYRQQLQVFIVFSGNKFLSLNDSTSYQLSFSRIATLIFWAQTPSLCIFPKLKQQRKDMHNEFSSHHNAKVPNVYPRAKVAQERCALHK